MNKICSLLILIFLKIQLLNAQIINGKITDLNTKESLIGVNIISEEGSGTASDIDGEYQLKLTEGNQKITFKYIGYEEITKTFNIAKNEILNLNIALSSISEELNTIVVSAGRFDGSIQRNVNLWDIAAGTVLIREAGGIVDKFKLDKFNKINIKASNERINNDLSKKISIF